MIVADLDLDAAALTVGWAVVGVVMLGIGLAVLDVLTPGALFQKVRDERNPNAAVLAASHMVAVTTILVTAAVTSSADDFGGLASAAGYAAIGIAVLAAVAAVYERARSSDLDAMFDDPRFCPLAGVMSVAVVCLGAVLAAAVS